MGVVYLGIHDRLRRPAAVKVLAPELAGDPLFRRRFLRECEVSVAIDHPNIIPVYDAGEFGHELYIAMRYVEGQDLRALLASEGTLSAEQTIAIVVQIASALDHAHSRGLVHRDVKPANVLLSGGPAPHCYLCDFGLSTFGTASSTDLAGLTTSTGELTGTVDYMAPERIAGNDAVPASDLYSLACLAVECLTGRPPFRRPTQLATLWAHMTQRPPPVAPDLGLPHAIDTVLSRGLAKEPGQRQQTCLELARQLREAVPSSPGTRPAHPRRRWPAVAVAGVVLLGVALIFLTTRSEPTAPDRHPTSAPLVAPNRLARITASGLVTAQVPVPVGTIGVTAAGTSVWVVSVHGKVTRLELPARQVITRTLPGTPTGVAGSGTSVWIVEGPGRSIVRLTAGEAPVVSRIGACCRGPWSVAASGDQVWIASNRSVIRMAGSTRSVKQLGGSLYNANTVAVVPGAAGSPPQAWLADGQRSIWRLEWRHAPAPIFVSPLDGSGWRPSAITAGWGSVWAAVPALPGVWRLRTDSGHAKPRVIEAPGGSPDMIAAGAGGVWVAESAAGTVWRIDPATNTADDPISVGSRIGGISAAAGGGVWVATTVDDASAAPGTLAFQSRGNLYVQRPGGEARQMTNTPTAESDPAWSPDGSTLAFTADLGGDMDIYTMAAQGGIQRLLTSTQGADSNPAWSPDGRTIAFVGSTGDSAGVYVADATGGIPRYLASAAPDSPLSWSPDGRRIAYLGGGSPLPQVRVLIAASGQSKALSSDPAQAPAWSPDGSAIAYWTPRMGGSIMVAPARGTQPPRPLSSLRGGRANRIAWSPDGRFLAISISRAGDDLIELLRSDGTRLSTLGSGSSAVWGPRLGSLSSPSSTS